MQQLLLIVTLFLISLFSANAQVSHGGFPHNWEAKSDIEPNEILLPELDYDALAQEDAVTDQHKDIPPRFAVPHDIFINFFSEATLVQTDNYNLYTLRVKAPNATSLGVIFEEYELTQNAKLFLYASDKNDGFIGAFTHKNNKTWGSLGIQPIFSDDIIIELQIPANEVNDCKLQIGTIAQGYRWFNKTSRNFGNSGSCNNNVICPISAGWENEIKSVGLIVTAQGSRICSGALINNTSNNGTPYFLTANHCLGAGTPNWVIVFNYQSSTCPHPGTDGSLNQSISGTTVQASSPGGSGTDMALLLLAETPPPSYNLFFSGWNRSSTPSTSNVGIHHPAGDVKKISFDDDPAEATPYLHQGTAPSTGGRFWRVENWENGTTEGGSSGSPLFDQNGYIIGQLYGGYASCSSITEDYYGRFDLSWPLLASFLDPEGTEPVTLAGVYPEQPDLNIGIASVAGLEEQICGTEFNIEPSVLVLNLGAEPVISFTAELYINEQLIESIDWEGFMEETTGSTTITFSPIEDTDLLVGLNNLEIEIFDPNGIAEDENFTTDNFFNYSFSFNPAGGGIIFELQRDRFGSETTWQFEDEDGNILASGGPYTNNPFWVTTLPNLLTFDYCWAPGCYTFKIFDSYGDGICCSFGEGYYNIINSATGDLIETGGEFEDEDIVEFCIEPTQIAEPSSSQNRLQIFPNPASNMVNINWVEPISSAPELISIIDISGKIVFQKRTFENYPIQLNLPNLVNGSYFIEIITQNNRQVEKLIIQR
jgi:lysyl endopeptidase